MESDQAPPKYVDEQTAADRLGLSWSTLRAWRRRGEGPRYARFGKAVRYDVADLDAFGESQKVAR